MEDTTTMEADRGLFADIKFTIMPDGLEADFLRQTKEDITAAGGTIIPFESPMDTEKLQGIEYIISATSDFPEYYKALDLMLHVVKPTFIEASIRASKVKNPRPFNPDPALFMNEVVVCCSEGIPSGDVEAIKGGLLSMGGQTVPTLSKFVTHLIALDITEPRCQTAISKRLHLKIVLPHWFDDCLKLGRKISERPYTLPDPEILQNPPPGKIPATKTSNHIRDATTPDPFNDPVAAPPAHLESARAIKVFEGKKVKLGEDLGLRKQLRDTISGIIDASGGEMSSNIDDVDIYICNYREGPDYVKASQDRKDVGNLSWLYYLITHGVWTNPMRRILHYPRPRNGIPGFDKYRISISSYTGEARVYLESLVKALGAEFSKTLRGDNTHLIVAHKNSEKYGAALEWGVKVANHVWLEESYAMCKEMGVTEERFTTFPSRTNLGEVLGQIEINREITEKKYFSKDMKLVKPTKPALESNTVPASSLPAPPFADDRADKANHAKTPADVQTPLPSRHMAEKENFTPGSRGAKDRALSKLHAAAPDIAQFAKEMKRKGGVIHGGRRRAEDEIGDRAEKEGSRDSVGSKRSIDEVDEDEGTEDEVVEEPGRNKKAKKEKLTPIKFRMLVSKVDRWSGNMEKESKEKARLRELGLFITDDWRKVDLLCAPQPVRTKKFIAALACAPELVSTTYLDFALKNNKLPHPGKHILDVRDYEEANDVHMNEALQRAKLNKHRLLRNWTIFCTKGISGGFETYKDIIEANGGKCCEWKGRTTAVTASRRLADTSDKGLSQNQEMDEGDVLYLISDLNANEFKDWGKFREMAKLHNMVPRIVKTEWILRIAIGQYVHWNPEWELREDMVAAAK